MYYTFWKCIETQCFYENNILILYHIYLRDFFKLLSFINGNPELQLL